MRYPSRSMGWLGSLSALLVAVTLSVVLVCPQEVFGRKKEPVKKDDIIDALISVTIKGAVEENRRQKVGSLTITASGKIKNESKAVGLNQYVPEGMSATYKYEYREIDLDPPRGCPPLALEEQGSGSVNVVSPKAGASATTGAFLLQVFMGQGGKGEMLQFTKRAGPDTMTQLSKEPPSDNYMFILAPVNMKITKKVRRKCPQYEYDEQDNKRVFALRVPFVELKQEGMSGSYSWQSKKFPYKHLGMKVTDVRGNITYDPKKEPGDVQYQVNWVFDKVQPEIQIYQITDTDKEPRDITNITKPKDILVGQKVKLEAKVIPAADPGQEGTWNIPEKRVIKGFRASAQKGEVIPFEDNKGKHVEFFFIDGDPSGRDEKISYTATVDGKKIEGKTTFKVFKPDAKLDKSSQKKATIGEWKYYDKNGNVDEVAPCRLTMGDQAKLPKGYASDPKETKGAAGMYIRGTVILPQPFSGQGHLLEYINLVKENVVECKDEGLYQIVFRHCTNKEDQWYSDKSYPYANLTGEGELVFNDSPGSDLSDKTKTITEHRQFQTFLMFRPSKDNDDDKSVWVPLKLVTCEYKTAADRVRPGQSSLKADPKDFRLTVNQPPNPVEINWTGGPEKYPQWRSNIDNAPKPVECGRCQ